MKTHIGNITVELKDDQFTMTFNKPNYTYQHLTVDEMEEFWQALMSLCGDYRRGGIIEQVNN